MAARISRLAASTPAARPLACLKRYTGLLAGARRSVKCQLATPTAAASGSWHAIRPAAFDSDDYEFEQPQQQQQAQQQQQQAAGAVGVCAEDAGSGGGLVGAVIAAWMTLIALVARLLSPAVSLVLALAQPLTRMAPARARRHLDKLLAELPEGFFARIAFICELPLVRRLRLTLSLANVGVRLPAMLALLLAQGSALASQVSLPMLAPLLLGTGMMLNTIKANAEYIMPRVGLSVVLLWCLWFINSVIQTSFLVLKNQGRIDARTMSGARMLTEVTSLLLAGIVLSSMGVRMGGLILPAGLVLAIACRDLLQNLIAGCYLVLVQPFRLGDKVAVSCTGLPAAAAAAPPPAAVAPASGMLGQAAAAPAASAHAGGGGSASWFEGTVEKVDLRYTCLRHGRRRLMVPNTAFVSQSFLVYDDAPPGPDEPGSPTQQPAIREGFPASELPPLAAPVFAGMTLVPPGMHAGPYAHYPAHQHYAPAPLQHQHQQPLADQQQPQHGAPGPAPPQAPAAQQQGQQGQQGAPGGSASSGTAGVAAVARGPPGYIPQGYYLAGGAAAHWQVPVYYGLPGTWDAQHPSSSTAAGAPAAPPPPPPQQQQQQHEPAEAGSSSTPMLAAHACAHGGSPVAAGSGGSDGDRASAPSKQKQQQALHGAAGGSLQPLHMHHGMPVAALGSFWGVSLQDAAQLQTHAFAVHEQQQQQQQQQQHHQERTHTREPSHAPATAAAPDVPPPPAEQPPALPLELPVSSIATAAAVVVSTVSHICPGLIDS